MENSTASSSGEERKYTINGIPVIFPLKPYPSQVAMMNKILSGLCRKQNCLLESPTGSGKSLALLCACLSWRKEEQRKINEAREQFALKEEERLKQIGKINGAEERVAVKEEDHLKQIDKNNKNESRNIQESTKETSDRKDLSPIIPFPFLKTSPYFVKNCENGQTEENSIEQISWNPKRKNSINHDDDDDFLPSKKYRTSATSSAHFKGVEFPSSVSQQVYSDSFHRESSNVSSTSSPNVKLSPKELHPTSSKILDLSEESAEMLRNCIPNSAPKIYFGTRTHKQIEQIVREFKRTHYRNEKMCILSSRERTCIHPVVSRVDHKNEACKELLDNKEGRTCTFFHNVHHISHDYLCSSGLGAGWNLEDLVQVCKSRKACPFYATRSLMDRANIVFCPYNYLIDPIIRRSLSISLKNCVVVLDEAHNIEDSAREAASFSLTQDELQDAVKDLEELIREEIHISSHMALALLLSGISSWIQKNKDDLPDYNSFDKKSKIWTGEELVAILTDIGAGPDDLNDLISKLIKVTETKSPEEEETRQIPQMTAASAKLLEGILVVLSFLYSNKLQYMSDYRAVIVKTASRKPKPRKSWLSSSSAQASWSYTLHIWCLNPAVAFRDFKDNVHSLIVASGTLSPMTSFQSELDMPFTIQLEASHVISPSQVWLGTIGKGLDGSILNATFQNSETFSFQDSLGQLVLKVCKIVPHGVLCFLPSYSMLEKLTQRWQMTGLWGELLQLKVIVCEPRGTDKVNFEHIMTEFYTAIKSSEDKDPGEGCVNGALFFAVCRGKVSEGLDFADNNARAVITVGIPFPNIKDIQVDQKRKYNDKYCSQRSLMSGKDWYETQAFRALNQALGRCLRHRLDWGALILVDERFQRNPRYARALSKWMRKLVVHYSTFGESMQSLHQFTSSRSEPPSKDISALLTESFNEAPSSPTLFE